MKQIDIPAKFPIPFAANADPANITAVPLEYTGVLGSASLRLGWPPETLKPLGAGGTAPIGQYENGIQKQLSSWARWQSAGATVAYDAAFATAIGGYPAGSILASAATLGIFFMSLSDDNVTDPDSGDPSWTDFTPIPLFANDTGSKNAMAIALVPAPATLAFFIGQPITIFKNAAPNDNAVVLTINGSTNIPVVHTNGSPIAPGELSGHGMLTGALDTNGNFQLLSGGSGSGPSSGIRTRLASNITFYINKTTGNDGFDGLTPSTAWATFQHAWDTFFTSYDFAGFNVTVLVSDAAYTAGINAVGPIVGQKSSTSLVFQSSSGSNTACTVTSTGTTFSASDNARYGLQGFGVTSTGGDSISANSFGHIRIMDGMKFNANPGNNHANAALLGRLTLQGTITVAGGAAAFCNFQSNASIFFSSPTINFVGNPAFSVATMRGFNGAIAAPNVANTIFTGSATGKRFALDTCAVLDTEGGGGNFIPGSIGGTNITGSQYV